MTKKFPANASGGNYCIESFQALQLHSQFVDETYDEAGKLPLLSMLLVEALHHYPNTGGKEFRLIPQARLTPLSEYKTDYAVALVETDAVSLCWNCTVQHLTSVHSFSGKDGIEIYHTV